MFERSLLSQSVLLAVAGAAVPLMSAAQSTDAGGAQDLGRVEVTGSAIKRVESEGALPVQILREADIKKTGATSVTDLIQLLPSMQGFVPASNSVNGSGGGATTAALHSLPSKYTLVLLDGQRVAPVPLGANVGGGFGVNLETIPLSAIDRVEILSDGASALYGSDAIAGVVNFILKKDRTDGTFAATYNLPQHAGGSSWNVNAGKGFGDLSTDGYNVFLAASHDSQASLAASQRSFSKVGAYFPFSSGGQNYIFNARTSNTEPANITFNARPTGSPSTTAASAYSLNPYYTQNGNCGNALAGALTDPAALGATGVSCRFNYAGTVQDIPSSTRDSGLFRGTLKVNDALNLWSELSLSEFKLTAQYAPAAQPLPLNASANGVLYQKYVVPYLNANNLTYTGGGRLGYRSVSLGGRADEFKTESRHFAVGLDGNFQGWDYNASWTFSHLKTTDTAVGGYSDFNMLSAAIASGAYDPVAGTGQSAVASAVLNTELSKTDSNLNTMHVGAQHDLFMLPGGASILALGADYSTFHYASNPGSLLLSQSGFSTQPASLDYPVGGSYGAVPFNASRANYGAFGELLLPVIKQLEITASGRYDHYEKTHSSYVFSTDADPVTGLQNQIADADLGKTFQSTTGKLSARFTPVQSVLLRGSYGSGFKAPNVTDIAGATTFAGSTSGSYACPFPGSTGCSPGSAQYDLLAGPNGTSGGTALKPETSRQWTLGFRVDPLKGLSLGADLWDVKIKNQVLSAGIAEQVGFANPTQYASLFVNPYQDPAGFPTIGFLQVPFNGGLAEYKGIDWDATYGERFDFGTLTARWSGTQMIRQQYNFGPGQPYQTDLGVFGPDQQVVFRTIMNIQIGLQTNAFLNTLTVHYKSGYQDTTYDKGTDIFLAKADGSLGASVAFAGLKVPSYTTLDWQTRYTLNKSVQMTAGIRNFLDRNPPLTLQSGGGGNQVGYDGRYTDPIGRTYYLSGQYNF